MKIYHYDSMGCLTHDSECEGEAWHWGETIYRLPVNATIEPPPEFEPGTVPIFLEQTRTWFIAKDHRGEVWFDIWDEPRKIIRPGNPETWNLTREKRYLAAMGHGARRAEA